MKRGKLYGRMSSDPSMVSTILGAVMLVLMPMGWGSGELSETYGKNLKLIRTLKWEMAGELSFGQMRGTNRFL